MRQVNIPQLSEVFITLKNINDNIRRIETQLIQTNTKIAQIEQKMSGATKHIVLLKTAEKKTKEKPTKRDTDNGRV